MRRSVLVLLAGCGGPSDEDLARDLFAEIDGWEDWTELAPWDGRQPSSDGTHGAFVVITFNDTAAAAWGEPALPDGSVIVKRGYDADDDGAARGFVTVMKKIDGYAPDEGDWFWARLGVDGALGSEIGRSTFCASCHRSGVDYLRTVTDVPGGG
jgi:hypothetical protein